MSFVWDESVVRDIEKALKVSIEKVGIHVSNEIKKKINTSQPYTISKGRAGRHYRGLNPSNPGEPPHKLTAHLQRSIAYKVTQGGFGCEVGTNLAYGAALEMGTSRMAARPYLRSTILEQEGKIMELFNFI